MKINLVSFNTILFTAFICLVFILNSCLSPIQETKINNIGDPVCSANVLSGMNFIMEKNGIENPDTYITPGLIFTFQNIKRGQAVGVKAPKDGESLTFYFVINQIKDQKHLTLIRLDKVNDLSFSLDPKPLRTKTKTKAAGKGLASFELTGCR